MGYEYPAKKHVDADVASPLTVNVDLVRAADTVNLIDAHNINAASLSANANVSTTAFGTRYAAYVASDPDFKTGAATYQYPDSSATDIFILEEHGRWQDIPGALVTTNSTGLSSIKCEGFVQYIWHGWTSSITDTQFDHIAHLSGSTASQFTLPANIQFAIKIDGIVVDESITGHTRITRTDFWPIKAVPEMLTGSIPIGASPTQPGPLQPKTQRIAGLGPQSLAIVLQAVMKIEPGVHTVKIVVRKLTSADTTQRVSDSNTDVISVYNRCLIVDEAPILPPITYSSTGVSVAAFENESVLSTQSMYTDRMNSLRTAVNNLTASNIRPYSLRYEHLPQMLLNTARFETIAAPSVITTDNWFDGESGVIAGASTGSTGWTLMHDGSGTNFETTTGLDVTTVPSFVRIRGHVHISYILDSAAAYTKACGFFVAVAIGYKMNGTWYIIQRSISYLNSWNTLPDAGGTSNEETPLSVLTYLDYRGTQPAHDITAFGLFCAVFSMSSYSGATPWPRVTVGWRQASLYAFQYRN